MLNGNKGEWSELYVLISLLADGKLYQSDVNLKKDNNNVYDIVKAYKVESDYSLEFVRGEEIVLYKVLKDEKLLVTSFTHRQIKSISSSMYQGIMNGKGRSFNISEVNDFLENALIQKLKADPTIKSDIKLKIYDHRLAKETDLGFSIKSLLGSNSTLFNTGPGNNFIYSSINTYVEDVFDFNKRTYSPPNGISKLTYRLQELEKLGINLEFKNIQSRQLWRNLKMVDGDLPDILGWALYLRWIFREPSLKKVADILEHTDPLKFYDNQPNEQKIYEYKLKRFLTEAAMGMTSEKPWSGGYDSFGGVIIAKSDGNIVCFHVYDFNLFRNYLINNTYFEQPSTGEDGHNPGNKKSNGKKYYYGWIYEENNELNFKINLQVRFK